jgi:CRISPR/Cas system-associated protein endoribonuclease Cas2
MKMTSLEQLYKRMKDGSVTQCPFPYQFNGANFSVLFDIETNPFTLLFGVIKENFTFSFPVEHGFIIKDFRLDDITYKRLITILKLKYDPNNKFSPFTFLKTFNEIVNTNFVVYQAKSSDRIHFSRDVEEPDKIYFQKWLPHHGERKVTEKNLDKTRKLLGEKRYQDCKERNISTCWTANKDEEEIPTFPLRDINEEVEK